MKLIDRKTNKLVEVPDEDVPKLAGSGLYGIPAGARVPVALESGAVGTVDASEAMQAFQAGATVPTAHEYHAAARQERYGGLGGAAAAAGAGALRGAGTAFGLPTDAAAVDAAGAFGSYQEENDPYRGTRMVSPQDRMREALSGLQEEHPIASMGGELAGMAGIGVLTGGESLLGAAGAAGEELLPTAAGRIARGVVRGASEGAGVGAVGAFNEAALGDTDATAEKVVAGMGHGAFMGAGLGAAFSGLGVAKDAARDGIGRFAGKLVPKDVEALAEKTFGHAPEGLGDRVVDGYTKLAAATAGKDPATIEKFLARTPEGAEARRVAVYDAPKIQEAAERDLRAHGDAMLREEPKVSELARGELKREFVEKSVKRGNEDEVRQVVKGQIEQLIGGVSSELEHPQGAAPQHVKALESTSKLAYNALDALEHGNGAAYAELDALKRGIQRNAANGTRGLQAIADPIDRANAMRSLDFFKGSAENLRGVLEDEALWGKPAAAQREVNAAWTKQIEARRRFNAALTTDIGRDPSDPYARLTGMDPQKLSTYVRGLVNPHQDLTHAAVRDYAASTRELVEAVKKHYDLGPEQLAAVEAVHKGATGFGKELGKAEKALVTANQYRALTEGTNDSLSAIGGVVGGLVGGLPGGIVGAAAGAVANPGRVVAQLAAVERLAMKVDTRIASGVRDFFRGTTRRPTPLHEAATPEGFDKTVRLLGEAVDGAGQITPAGRAKIADAIGDLGEGAPNLAVAVSMKAMDVAMYLAGKLPPAMRSPYDMFPGDEPPLVSDTERETFARYVQAAQDPMSVVDHLAKGDVTPEEADVLKRLYPRLYEQTRAQIGAVVRAKQAEGKPLPYERRVSYGVLFEVRTDATMDPEMLQLVAAAQAAHGGKKGGGMPPVPRLKPVAGMGSRLQTSFEASSSRRGALQ